MVDGPPAASWQRMAEAARAEAAEIGADAVFLGDVSQYQSGTIITDPSAVSPYYAGPVTTTAVRRKQATAIAIVYVE